MKKIVAGLTMALVLALVAAPSGNSWAWRTHGGTFGSRGIAMVALWRITKDTGVSASIRENLKEDLIRFGSVAPDRWRSFEDIGEGPHIATWVENRGENWLIRARNLVAAGNVPWDNVSYILGIASHYHGEMFAYVHHDNARRYFENLYGPADYYQVWGPINDHFEDQVKFYRPKDPALIISPSGGAPAVAYRYATTEPDPLVDGSSRIGSVTGGSLANTQGSSPDGSYEQISEANTGSVSYVYLNTAQEEVVEGGTTGASGAWSDDGTYENIYESDYGGSGGTYEYINSPSSNSGAWTNPTNAYTNDTNYAYSATNNQQHVFGGYGFSVPSNATIDNVSVRMDAWCTGNDGIKLEVSTDGGSTWLSTTYSIANLPTTETTYWVEVTGWTSWTPSAVNNIATRVTQLKAAAQDQTNLDWIPVYVKYTVPAGAAYRLDVRENITGIPAAASYTLQVEYYTSGDSEPITLYIWNFSASSWDNAGNLQTGGSAGNPYLFENNIDSNHISGGTVRIRFSQPNGDSSQTSLMVDFIRVAYGTTDYRLNWEHRITGVVTGRDNYTLKIYGRRGSDETVNVYVRNFTTSSWELVGTMNTTDNLLLKFIAGSAINNYLSGGAMSVLYSQNNADTTPTTIYLDFVVLEENYTTAGGAPYGSLEAFLNAARPQFYAFFDRVMNPNDWSQGWLHDWIRDRKCEDSDYSHYSGNPGVNVHYGTKELVDMATEVVYSGWVYALGIQNQVTSDRITWTQWWERSHRTPGIIYA